MLISNIPIFLRMLFDGDCIKIVRKIHRLFSENSDYRFTNLIRCGMNVVKNDRIKLHDGKFIVNSFIPPLNSRAYESILMGVPGRGSSFFNDHISGKRKAPISVYIAATERCMYNCWHCSAAGRAGVACNSSDGVSSASRVAEQNRTDELNTAEMISLVKQLQDMGVGIIGFTGGEPLLRKDLEEIIRNIDERSVSFVFSTGYGLTRERAKELKESGLLGIAISIDSTDEEIHDRKRGCKGAFNAAVEAIKNAKAAGLYTMSQTVCTRELLRGDGLFDLSRFMKELNVDEMRIIEPLPCGKLGSNEQVLLSDEENKKLRELHVNCNRNPKMPKASVFSYFESADQFGCGAGVQHSYIDAQGNLYPCDFVPVSFGNVFEIFERPVSQLWEKMHEQMGAPREYCFSKVKLNGIFKNYTGSYPADVESLAENCCKCDTDTMPAFYRKLAGKKADGKQLAL